MVHTIQKFLIGAVVLTVVGAPLHVGASPVVRSGESVTLAADQKVSGDFYTAAGTVSISGSVEGDLYAAGGTITVNGAIAEDAVLAGGNVSLHAPVSDDVRIVGGQVTIAEHIEGDLVVFAGTLSILSTAQIDGDLLFYGGTADVSGPVDGSIHTYAESLRVNARIGGDITATVGRQLSLSPTADIGGSIAYRGRDDIVRAPGSVVVGDIAKTAVLDGTDDNVSRAPLFQFLLTLFSVLVLLLLFGSRVGTLILPATQLRTIGYNTLIGFGAFVLMPLSALLLMVSVLGVFVGMVVLFSYILLLLLSWIMLGVWIGALIARAVTNKPKVSLLYAGLGVFALHVIFYMPFVGKLAAFFGLLVMLGTLTKAVYTRIRS